MTVQGLNRLTPYYFILPAAVIIAVGLLYPVAHSIYSSFFDWRMGQDFQSASFVGLENYRQLLWDAATRESIVVTLFFAATVVSIEMVLGFALALLLDRQLKGGHWIRTIFMLPMMVAPIVVGLIWRYLYHPEVGPINRLLENLYHPEVGPINRLLESLGFAGIEWLSSPQWAFVAIVIADVWQWTPFIFILCLAGLQNIPKDIIAAAKLDGASTWQCVRFIQIPMLMPVLIVTLLLRLIDAFKVLEVIFIMTNGGPGMATEILSLRIYKEAFVAYELGRASALSNMLLMLVATITVILLLFQAMRKKSADKLSRQGQGL